MNIIQYIIALTIAIIYPFFWKKLSDTVVKKYIGDTDCGITSLFDNKISDDEVKKCRQREKYMETIRFIVLLIVAVLGIFIGSLFTEQSITTGLGLGGLISAVTAVTYHWNNMGETTKVAVLGASLFSLIGAPFYIDIKKIIA